MKLDIYYDAYGARSRHVHVSDDATQNTLTHLFTLLGRRVKIDGGHAL
jgi:hypothetical protein